VTTNAKALTAHIRELIATPSVSSVSADWDMPNTPVITALASRLEHAGWQVEIQDLPDKAGKQNLIATLGKGEGGLILSGHTDTVPCNEKLWSSDPFSLHERDNRFYGLGTADMKSFLAMAMAACADIDPTQLKQPVILLATADEESSMGGARALVAAGKPRARYAVIGEPTDLKPIRMHKGIFMESIKVQGRSGHSSDPGLGANALEGMHKIIGELISWRDNLQQNFRNDAFHVPVNTMNLGHIHGGDNPNRICGDCELQIDLRFIPGLNRAELREELHTRARQALRNDATGLQLSFTSLFDGIEPMDTPAESSLIKAAEELTGTAAGAVAYATEAPFLAQLGIEVVVLGPGSINQAHQPDEYLEMNQIEPTVKYLQKLIRKFCL
jgi:acetylornithine deacetylase